MQKQTGSVHAVIIILLTLGLIGSVGFIFWQNFIVNGPTRGAVQSNKSTKRVRVSLGRSLFPLSALSIIIYVSKIM